MIGLLVIALCLLAAGDVVAEEGAAPPRVVVVDAGHGGRDPGAIGVTGVAEKDVTLRAAHLLQAALADQSGLEVVLTRATDRYLSLRERLALVAAIQADLFVSLHADSLPVRPGLRGASVYTLASHPSNADAARKARRENAEDVRLRPLAGVDDPLVAGILVGLMQTYTATRSFAVAERIVAALDPIAVLLPRPQLAADFVVLRSLRTPSVLVELGYLSNSADEALLEDPEHIARLTAAIASAVVAELRPQPPTSTRTTAAALAAAP